MRNLKKNAAIVVLFLFMMVYYLRVNPMYIFDTDDWLYVFPARSILPIWGAWNPIKALPEVLMPLLTFISYIFIYPFTGNIITASAIIYGFFCALCVTFLLVVITNYFFSQNDTFWIITIFLIFACLLNLFNNGDADTPFVFGSQNVTCVFNYMVPNIFNMILVIKLIQINEEGLLIKEREYVKVGVFLLFIYLCIFSNLYSNILPVVYAGVSLAKSLIAKFKNKNLKNGFAIKINIIILFLWFVALIFEYNGGRAQGANSEWIALITLSLTNLLSIFRHINPLICFLFVLMAILAIIFVVSNKKMEVISQCSDMILCEIGVIAYYVLLDAKVGIGHINDGSTSLCILFFILIISVQLWKELCNNLIINKGIKILFPFLLCLLLSIFFLNIRNVRIMNINALEPKTIFAITEDMMIQLDNAIEKGETSVEIHVPNFGTEDNWPLAMYGANRFSSGCYLYGKTKRHIEASFVIDNEKNVKFGIN